MDYEHVMKNTFPPSETPIASQRRGQMDWLVNENGKVIVDYVGKFENLEKDFEYIRKRLKIIKPLPKTNSTKHGFYRDVYDSEMIEFVRKQCASDIEVFDYEF
jgi:hypothetical protein